MKSKQKAIKKACGKKEKEEYEMPISKALHEHERLIKRLKSKKNLKDEIKEQKKDLKDIKK
jgi:fructose-specific phosphotransferase system component IIB